MQLPVTDRVAMPGKSRATTVCELLGRADPFDRRVRTARKSMTRVAKETLLDVSLKLRSRDHQRATATAYGVGAGRLPTLVRCAQHTREATSRRSPFGRRQFQLDLLAGQGSGHQDDAIRRLDHRVAPTADGANVALH